MLMYVQKYMGIYILFYIIHIFMCTLLYIYINYMYLRTFLKIYMHTSALLLIYITRPIYI